MKRTRLALLNASHSNTNTSRNFRREIDASLSEFHVTDGDFPQSYNFDGVVITGSRSSVYWDEPWIEPTKSWVRSAIDAGLPILGVCWGHQLLADVLGGTVSDMGEYEVGYNTIEHTGQSPLFSGINTQFLAFTSHSDAVTELPPGAIEIASNEYSNHGYQCGHVFGIQFHPEYDMKSARDLVLEKDLSSKQQEELLDSITQPTYDRSCESKIVFDNFLAIVEEQGDNEQQTNALQPTA